ncbi:hypothetical protein FA13DRAFT_1736395 [Coprinellus micaceus]|uniref:F-box domain-containing protein n=1 Tax=Coprinellus micaceus TaxID=71717 RepID=A0A4Y7T092_COPMI|nr:hypothetical protein FA13DRAFT_1736395 [Coprinellus micaceus]
MNASDVRSSVVSAGAPVHKIPDDVLREIFLFSLRNTPVRPSATQGPLQVSQVCSGWRAVAHDYCRLWNSLVIERPYLSWELVEETTRWLQRSNNIPVDFHLIITSNEPIRIRTLRACLDQGGGYTRNLMWSQIDAVRHDDQRRARYEAELKDLLSNASPLPPPNTLSKMLKPTQASVTRLVLCGVPVSNLAHLPRRAFPHLERLVVVVGDKLECWEFDRITRGPVKAFLDCPSLRYVALKRFFREPGNEFIQLPLHQLTHFIDCGPFYDATDHPCKNIARLLSATKDLRLLHVSFDDDYEADFPPELADCRIAFPSLESLSIDSADLSEAGEQFSSLFAFPKLQSLRYHGCATDIESLLRNSGETLTHLSLTLADDLPEDFIELLSQQCPHLRSLEIIYDVLCLVLHTLSSASLLPNLEVMAVRFEYPQTYVDDEIAAGFVIPAAHGFFQSRIGARSTVQEHPQRFRTFKIVDGEDSRDAAEHIRTFLERCRDEVGVQVEVVVERFACTNGCVDSLLSDIELVHWDGLSALYQHPLDDFGDFQTPF